MATTRTELRDEVFGAGNYPTSGADSSTSVANSKPFPHTDADDNFPSNCTTTEHKFDVTTADGAFVNYAYEIVPSSPSGDPVFLCQGHFSDSQSEDLGSFGMGELAADLLNDGRKVVLFSTPLRGENTGPVADHDDMTDIEPFADQLVRMINELDVDVVAVGWSIGALCADLLAALDGRVKHSIPCHGTLPDDLRIGASVGDFEQTYLPDNSIPLLDVMTLATSGTQKRTQIVRPLDPSFFAGPLWRNYEDTFDVVVDPTDEAAHTITQYTHNLILNLLGDRTAKRYNDFPELSGTWIGNANAVHHDAFTYYQQAGSGFNTATFVQEELPAGDWKVEIGYRTKSNRASNVKVLVVESDSSTYTATEKTVAMNGSPDQYEWHNLGTYNGPIIQVALADGPGLNGQVIADCVRISPV